MSRYTKTQITQLSANEQAALNAINKNFEDLEAAIQDTVSRSGNTPTHMTNDLDMNGKRLINVPAPRIGTDLVRQQDVVGDIETVQQLVNTTTNAAAQTLKAAQDVQDAIEDRHLGIVADDLALGDDSKIKKDADNIEDITTVADNISAINTANSNITNIDKVADDISNVNTVAGDISNVNTCASNISAITSAPTYASNAYNSATDAASSATAAATAASTMRLSLFDFKWTDYEQADQSWLRADTFSWQDGTVYSNAYNHLAADLGTIGQTIYYAWVDNFDGENNYWYTTSATPSVGDNAYKIQDGSIYDTSTVDTFGADSILVVCDARSYTRDITSDIINQSDTTSSGAVRQTETIGSYTITCWLATDGHKICTPDQETTVNNIYNESGVAWYYILDTANQRFKLPRENPAREELIQTLRAKGNGLSLGVTDGSTTKSLMSGPTYPNQDRNGLYCSANYSSNALPTNATENNFNGRILLGITKDSTKSGIISSMTDSTSVYKGNKYLYFYVGQFSQSATEQTAGLNSELFNGKVDLNLNNMNPSATAKETIVGWGMPDFSAGVSITFPYTCPKNGFYIGITTNNNVGTLYVNGVQVVFSGNYMDNSPCCFPVSAGDVITGSQQNRKFYPCKGV